MKLHTIKLKKGQTDIPKDLYPQGDVHTIEVISPTLEILPDLFKYITHFKYLSLMTPALKEIDFTSLKNIQLEKLKIKNATELQCLGDFSYLTSLTALSLSGLGLISVPNWVFQNFNLMELDLGSNKLLSIADDISKLKILKRINFEKNELTHLPRSMSNLANLSHLNIVGNNFDDDEKQRISKVFNINID